MPTSNAVRLPPLVCRRAIVTLFVSPFAATPSMSLLLLVAAAMLLLHDAAATLLIYFADAATDAAR